MTRSWREGVTTLLDMHWLVGSPEGVEHVEERHVTGLYTDTEYRGAFSDAGCTVEHDPEGLIGRGLYVGVRS